MSALAAAETMMKFSILEGWTATICGKCGNAEIRPPERLLGWSGSCGQWVPVNREPSIRSPRDSLHPYPARLDLERRVWCGGQNRLVDLTQPRTAREHTVAEYALVQARKSWDAEARRTAHQQAGRRGARLRQELRHSR